MERAMEFDGSLFFMWWECEWGFGLRIKRMEFRRAEKMDRA